MSSKSSYLFGRRSNFDWILFQVEPSNFLIESLRGEKRTCRVCGRKLTKFQFCADICCSHLIVSSDHFDLMIGCFEFSNNSLGIRFQRTFRDNKATKVEIRLSLISLDGSIVISTLSGQHFISHSEHSRSILHIFNIPFIVS